MSSDGFGVRIGRTVPPAAAPLSWKDLWHGVAGAFSPARFVRALEQGIREHFGWRRHCLELPIHQASVLIPVLQFSHSFSHSFL
jgi:hypothetical protein